MGERERERERERRERQVGRQRKEESRRLQQTCQSRTYSRQCQCRSSQGQKSTVDQVDVAAGERGRAPTPTPAGRMMTMMSRTRHRPRSCQGQTSCMEVAGGEEPERARPVCLALSQMAQTRVKTRVTGPTRPQSHRAQMDQVGSVENIGEGATRSTPPQATTTRTKAPQTSETLPQSPSSPGQTTQPLQSNPLAPPTTVRQVSSQPQEERLWNRM